MTVSAKGSPKRGAPRQRDAATDDTAVNRLTPEQRAKLAMDAWEPSLLRHLLRAENEMRGSGHSEPAGVDKNDR